MSDARGLTEGWMFPHGARKAHFFRELRSLCGSYGMFPIESVMLQEDTGTASRDDCAGCRRRLEGRKR